MDNKTKYCSSCWREIDINADTCECGARFSEPPAPPEKESPGQMGSIEEQREVQAKKTKSCSNCGAEMTIRRQICPKCGVRVVMPSAVVPQEAPRIIGLSYVAGWIAGGFLLFVGVMNILSGGRDFIFGLLITMGALMIFPPVGNYLRRAHKIELSEWLKWSGFIFFVYLAGKEALYVKYYLS